MAGSKLVGTSSSTRTLDERDLSSLRPARENAPRPRKPTVLREVTNGIVCFCGERFGESQALDFMLHLRAEFGEDLAILERYRKRQAEAHKRYVQKPEVRERLRERDRLRAEDPEYVEHKREYMRQRYRDSRERITEQQREYRQRPEVRDRRREWQREWRARKKAEREAAQ